MKDYTESMLANAHNNWRWSQGHKNAATSARAVLDDPRYVMLYKIGREEHGTVYTALEDVPREELKLAMEWYREHTGWSAFKRKDCEKAYAALN